MTAKSKTITAIRGLLAKGDATDRCTSCRALGVLGDNTAVADLVERLRDEDIDVCVDAAEALGRIGDPCSVTPLLESLDHDPSGEVRNAVISALGAFDDPRVNTALMQIIADRPNDLEWDGDWDPWWDIQLRAVEILGLKQASEAVSVLSTLLNDEDMQDIESETLKALAQMGKPGVKILAHRLHHGTARQRRRAAHAMAYADNTEVTRILGQSLQDASADVRIAAIESLTQLQIKHYLGVILLLMRDTNADVRNAALKAAMVLSQLEGSSGITTDQLKNLLADRSEQVRLTALQAVSTSTARPLSEELTRVIGICLQDPDSEVVAMACELLSEIPEPSLLNELITLLKDSNRNERVRRAAALALSKVAGQQEKTNSEVIQAFMMAARDEAAVVRVVAVQALVELESDDHGDEQSPLAFVIDLLRGDFLQDTPTPQTQKPDNIVVAFTDTPETKPAHGNIQPEEAAHVEYIDVDTDEEFAELPLATSTLAAITMDNVETAILLDQHAESEVQQTAENDESLQEYEEIVRKNAAAGEWLLASRKKPALHQQIRCTAARMLATSNNKTVINALIETLSDPDDELRRECADAISIIAHRHPQTANLMNAFGALLTQLHSEHLDLRLACLRALEALGNRAALPMILELGDDKEASVRIQSIRSLVTLATQAVIPQQTDHMVLEEIEPPVITRRLFNSLDDSASGVRSAAIRGLLSWLKHNPELCTDKQMQILTNRMLDAALGSDGSQAREMGRALRLLDPELSVEPVLQRLQALDDSALRRFVLEVLEELYRPETPDSLLLAGQAA